MTTTRRAPGSARPTWSRVPAAGVGAALMLAAGAMAAPAAAAGPAPDAWVSSNDEGYYHFDLPQAEVHDIVGGQPSVVELQGNIGPAGTWSDLALDPSGANYHGGFGPVEPGLYYYTYTATMADRSKVSFREPSSPVAVTSQPEWNTFFVPGPGVEWMADVADGGEVSTFTYRSKVTKADREALVWTHPDYDGRKGRPASVLYLLADEAQSHQEWAQLGRVPQILDNLAASGDLEPMVVVMADVNTADPHKELTKSLVPAVNREYRVAKQAGRQAVAGIGSGAETALRVLVKDPGTFGSVGSFSGALPEVKKLSKPTVNKINARTDLLRLYVGNVLDPAYNDTEAALRTLEDAGIDHQFDGVDPDHGATWDTWREALHDFAPRLFQKKGPDGGPRDGHLPLDAPYEAPAPGSITTPHVDENGIVTFETGTQWADASDVTVWANWAPNGAWFRIQMDKVGDRWRTALGPLDGFYYYRYVVDGVDEKDPADTVNTLTGVSPLFVPGQTDHLLADAPADQAGDLSVLTYHSEGAGEERSAYVWTPPDYDPDRAEPYPLFVLNHGGGQSWGDWVEVGRAPQILDNLYQQGEIEEMVVVMPNGNVPDYQAEVFNNLLPAVDGSYHVTDDPQQRAMAGLSMGAMNTLNTWLNHPGEFGYIGSFSGFVFVTPETDVEAINDGTTLAVMYTGDTSDFTYDFTMDLLDMLSERGIAYEFDGATTGPHGFDTWSLNLIDFLPRLFTQEAPVS